MSWPLPPHSRVLAIPGLVEIARDRYLVVLTTYDGFTVMRLSDTE